MDMRFHMKNKADLHAWGRALTTGLQPGDTVLLHGDLGAGKTSLARSIIQNLCGSTTEVTSPTFLLVQDYPLADGGLIQHYDLYRLERDEEIYELGIEEALGQALVLVEWPHNIAFDWPKERLEITIRHIQDAPDARLVVVSAHGRMVGRIENAISSLQQKD